MVVAFSVQFVLNAVNSTGKVDWPFKEKLFTPKIKLSVGATIWILSTLLKPVVFTVETFVITLKGIVTVFVPTKVDPTNALKLKKY